MRYISMDESELRSALLQDIRNIGRDNLVRDNKIAYTLEMRIHTPYLQWDIIEMAINIPANLKIRKENGEVIRKYILRKLALEILPRDVALRKKKAIQYSTKTMDILRKIARNRGMKVDEYLQELRRSSKSSG
jgi:asparagine synthase (glutamine-hydrolysing)